MKIVVASKNNVKINAVKELIQGYALLKDAEIISVEANSGVSEQPKSLQEIITGATTRAKNAFGDCDYSIGIESGLMKVPHTNCGYLNISSCAIYDGKKFHIGLTSGFEYPKEIMDLVLNEALTVEQAAFKSGFTHKKNIGEQEGVVSHLTNGRVNRTNYLKQAVLMALVQIEHPEWY